MKYILCMLPIVQHPLKSYSLNVFAKKKWPNSFITMLSRDDFGNTDRIWHDLTTCVQTDTDFYFYATTTIAILLYWPTIADPRIPSGRRVFYFFRLI